MFDWVDNTTPETESRTLPFKNVYLHPTNQNDHIVKSEVANQRIIQSDWLAVMPDGDHPKRKKGIIEWILLKKHVIQ